MISKDFLSEELMEKVLEPYSNEKKGVNNYGLGFRLKVFDEGKKLTYHNGWWHGSNTVFIHLRESKTTIIALSNKYSRKIYGTMLLSTLFEDFPHDQTAPLFHRLIGNKYQSYLSCGFLLKAGSKWLNTNLNYGKNSNNVCNLSDCLIPFG